ncbi:hypothetical protein [Leptospira santarosai]|uniref:hypothetical protein n=1 Tax=Leptospira santarosai TaxID=28183 RepID=UPI00034D0048|nr:hypothetical protein [Leptospira santarosai]
MKFKMLIFIFWMIAFLRCDERKVQPYAERVCVKPHTTLIPQITYVGNTRFVNYIPVQKCDFHEWRIIENDTVYRIKELEKVGPLK